MQAVAEVYIVPSFSLLVEGGFESVVVAVASFVYLHIGTCIYKMCLQY